METGPYTGVVYLATNTVNGKCYIGKSLSGLQARRLTHLSAARRGVNLPFASALRKYGADAFAWATLFSSDVNDALLEAEIELITAYSANGYVLYNITFGGEGGQYARKPTGPWAEPMPQDTRDRIRASWTPERRAAQAEKQRTRVITEATREASRLAHVGKKLSAESIAKMAATKTGKKMAPWTEERRAKHAATWAAKENTALSDERKAHLSALAKARMNQPGQREKYRTAGKRGAAVRWNKPTSTP